MLTSSFRLVYSLLLLVLLLGAASQAQACIAFGGVIDGDVLGTPPSGQVVLDSNCTIRNWPASNPLTTNFSFNTLSPGQNDIRYLIVFDNVVHTGQMSCNAVLGHKIWFTNGSSTSVQDGCQNVLIPVEKIDKQSPAPTAAIGVPFTYTLTIPVLFDPGTGNVINSSGSLNELHSISVRDDLSFAATGVDLTILHTPVVNEPSVTIGGVPIPYTYADDGSNGLSFSNFDFSAVSVDPNVLPANMQMVIEIDVVLDNTGNNLPGTQFINTATWDFGRAVDLNENGVIDPGEFFTPLPGESGIATPMIIAEPDLVVTKTSNQTALNLNVPATYTIDVQNTGAVDAWDVTIEDQIPHLFTVTDAGMCELDPSATVTARVYAADGTTPVSPVLTEGPTPLDDYELTFVPAVDGSPGTPCELRLEMKSAAAVIGPTQRLIVTYTTQLDSNTIADGVALTNVAGATLWHGADPDSGYPHITYPGLVQGVAVALTDGTPTISDHEDSYTVTTGLSGYFFQKTVQNLTSGANPATTAVPGDILHYQLRVFNVDQTINNITITDVMDSAFSDNPISNVTVSVGGATIDTTSNVLTITGLNIGVGTELIVEFDVTLNSTGLTNNDVVPNQAILVFDNPNFPPDPNPTITTLSDNPFVNGIAAPGDPADSTDIVIQAPGPLSKVNSDLTQTTATIGEQITYTITVPATAVNVPLYDVRITDVLTDAGKDLDFASASTTDPWILTSTYDGTSVVIEDLVTGIDIPAGQQAVIEVTVRVANEVINQGGLVFNNTASYTYNRTDGNNASQTSGSSGTSGDLTVIEPAVSSIIKTANNLTPNPGDIVRYSVTLTASSGANFSDVFDVMLTDNLDLGLVYSGNPTVTVGAGISADNTIAAPFITGDGITTAQTLSWDNVTSDIDIVTGGTVTIEYDVLVLGTVLANQSLSNSVVAQWTSLDGSVVGERTGIDGIGGLNDYITDPAASVTVTTPNFVATINKVRSNDTYSTAIDNEVRVGDIVEYTLTISAPEGTLSNLQLVDTLPQGLDFEGIVSINGSTGPDPFTANLPFSYADIPAANIVEAGDPTAGPTTVTLTLGDITNQPNDGVNDDFVIVYRARVLNAVLDQTNLNLPLNNTIDMTYDTATGTETQSDIDTEITVLQPSLAVNKTVTTASGFTTIGAGELITYTVDITNNGTSPAYDTVLEDVLPVGLDDATVNTTSISLLVLGTTPAPFNPVFNAGTRTLTWDFDGVLDAIPVGDTLQIVYTVQADAVLAPGLTLTNVATASLYYSFDDEVVPTLGTVVGVREIYGPSLTSSTTLYTGAPPTKVLNPVITEATIGEEVVYYITIPGTALNADIYDVVITDTLDPALEYISATDVSANSFSVADNLTVGNNVILSISQIPTGQQAVIELRTRVANNASANAGAVVTNVASYSYAFSAGGTVQPTQSSVVTGVNDTFTIVEPLLSINKTVENVTSPGNAPTAGDVLRYTITLPASGGGVGDNFSDAFDVTINDTLSLGLAYQTGTSILVVGGNSITDPAVVGDGVATPQNLTWDLANATDIDIIEGTTVTVTYEVIVLNGVQAGQVLSNSAYAQWTGLDGNSALERDGSNTPAVNDYFTASVTQIVNVPDNYAFAKTRLTDTYVGADANVRVGDIIEYELRLTVQEGTTSLVTVADVLPQGLAFEGIVSINGDTTSPYNAVAPFTHNDITPSISGDPVIGPSTLTLSIGDIINAGDNNLANDDFVIIYRARVLNDVLLQAATTTLTNNASFVYTSLVGQTTRVANSDITLQQPILSVNKGAAPTNGDTVLDAGELVIYTVDIINTGDAPAYDVYLEDTIPVGMRNGTATITMVSNDLVSGAALPILVPAYDAVTGLAVWDFDNGGANTYTIPANDTLRVIYRVQAEDNLAPGLTLTNSALVQSYYSFDDEAVPTVGASIGVRQQYGPTAPSSVVLTTAAAIALDKQNTQPTAVVGVPFTYRIVLPATPQATALNDVRILDDLTASAADLTFVSVVAVGSPPWTPVNTGTATNLVIEDTTNGIDIPAGTQIAIDITVVLTDIPTNVAGLAFNNTADYTFNQVNDDAATQTPGLPDTTADMTIVEPNLTLEKTGPPTLRVAVPGNFTLNIHNTGTAPAHDITVTDLIPNPVPGGMCDDTPPTNFVAQITLNDLNPVGAPLLQGTDYDVNFVGGTPTCTLTFTMLTPAAALPADYRLLITYDAYLDADSGLNQELINHAGVTEWFSADTVGAGATGSIRTYTRALTDIPTAEAALDHEDVHRLFTEVPVISVSKEVANLTTAQGPVAGLTATPGDILTYTITIRNLSPVPLLDYTVTDDVDRLNASAMFVPSTLSNVSVVPTIGNVTISPAGGVNGTDLLTISNLTLAAQGDAGGNDVVTIVFDVVLAPSIANGTVVLDQAEMVVPTLGTLPSDDPIVNGQDDPTIPGGEDPTPVTITSAPLFQVQKISDDITGSAAVLLPGDTLRYTITVKNIGTEDAINASLRDLVPANTTYVANSTTLNGTLVADPAPGVSPLEASILINAPENTTPGYMRADTSATISNVATIIFDVVINTGVLDGTIISNQGYVNADGAGGIAITEQPSDDPDTVTADDPTTDIVGSLPLVDAQKTVELVLALDINGNGQVDPGDTLRYTITITNNGAVPATGVRLVDVVPTDTSYVANSVYLNGEPVGQPDGGVSPLDAGIDVSSADQTPPLPTAGNGYLSPGNSATVVFDVTVNGGVAPSAVISNQGVVSNNELPDEPTDADGDDSNGDQPTTIVVGDAQLLEIVKQVAVVGGGAAQPSSVLEYTVTVTNVGTVPAYDVMITDDLNLVQMSYVAGSATLNGSTTGTSYVAPTVIGDYSTTYGPLPAGQTATLRFRVVLDAGLLLGDTATNTGVVTWNAASQTASASVSIGIGGVPGVGTLSGRAWHDADFDNVFDAGERILAGWTVELRQNGSLIGSVLTDASGAYTIGGVPPNYITLVPYELRFVAPGATSTTALLGRADSNPLYLYINGLQYIGDIVDINPGASRTNLNLPIDPNGVVYDSVVRTPVVGATLTMTDTTGAVLPAGCFDDVAQQGQVTLVDGYYKFDINFSLGQCPAGGDYIIIVTPPANNYIAGQSTIIPPGSTVATPYSVLTCPGDAVPATANSCEVQTFETAPVLAIAAGAAETDYYLHLTLGTDSIPADGEAGESQIFNNHIPLDPDLGLAVGISKVSSMVNVSRGDMVPYTITINNTLPVALTDVTLIDTIPAGFKYVAGSARLNGVAAEPVVNGLQLSWLIPVVDINTSYTVKLLLVVGSGVQEGEYINRAQMFSTLISGNVSEQATATVRVVPDPVFDCSDIIGKVFDDKNLNGHQDENEPGLQGVRLATARGLLVTTDKHGRFHITCAAVPDEQRGSNFIIKLDERTLPTGHRVTTENPRVQRITRGKMMKFNFGATVHRVVRLDVADGVFETDSDQIRPQWLTRVGLLIEELRKAPSVLRLTYLGDVEEAGLVEDRLDTLHELVKEHWDSIDSYKLVIEEEVFWRNGSPGGGLD